MVVLHSLLIQCGIKFKTNYVYVVATCSTVKPHRAFLCGDKPISLAFSWLWTELCLAGRWATLIPLWRVQVIKDRTLCTKPKTQLQLWLRRRFLRIFNYIQSIASVLFALPLHITWGVCMTRISESCFKPGVMLPGIQPNIFNLVTSE